jgi:hypothetical protein
MEVRIYYGYNIETLSFKQNTYKIGIATQSFYIYKKLFDKTIMVDWVI